MTRPRKPRAVQTFVPVIPHGMTHNDLEAYVFTRGKKQVAGIRKGARLKAAEAMVAPYLDRAAPSAPLKGMIRQRVKYCFDSHGRHAEGSPMAEPPDIDNLTKVLNDLCQRFGYIDDDAHVVDFAAIKAWSSQPGIFIRFEELQ